MAAIIAFAACDRAPAGEPPPHIVRHLKITLLSTGLSGGPGAGLGEWGFAALVEADDERILYDTGGAPDLVLRNASALKIDLSSVKTVVLSHNHPDHVGGLVGLRNALRVKNPDAISHVEVGEGIFVPRYFNGTTDRNALNALRADYERTGGIFEIRSGPYELAPGVWLTGPVPRRTREQNWQAAVTIPGPNGPVSDEIAEETALVIRTADGLVILTGCGHAGIVNIVTYARQIGAGAPVLAIVGGLHLAEVAPATVDWTASQLLHTGVRFLLAAHCSGLNATARLRHDLGLLPDAAALGAVGSTFTLGEGLHQPLSAL